MRPAPQQPANAAIASGLGPEVEALLDAARDLASTLELQRLGKSPSRRGLTTPTPTIGITA
jgi:hypothetical protein